MPVFDMTEERSLNRELDVFRFGLPPSRIDLMTKVLGLDFYEAFQHSTFFMDGDLKVRLIHINDLVFAKRASGRPRDLDDIEGLSKAKE